MPSKDKFEHDQHAELAAATLTGDVRDAILDQIRNLQSPWQKAPEAVQEAIIESISKTAEHLVRECVKLVASAGRKVITGNLDQIVVKDGIKAVVKLSKSDPYRHELMDSQGQAVLIVVADPEEFTGSKDDAKADLDQPNLLEAA